MIHYNVWFSFKDEAAEADQLLRVRSFVDDLKSRDQIHDFHLLKNRATKEKSRLEQFHAVIVFRNDEQFGAPFREVSALGIHAGRHGFMIENVSRFVVEIFEEVPDTATDRALRDAAPDTP